jgi:hypothetical protein
MLFGFVLVAGGIAILAIARPWANDDDPDEPDDDALTAATAPLTTLTHPRRPAPAPGLAAKLLPWRRTKSPPASTSHPRNSPARTTSIAPITESPAPHSLSSTRPASGSLPATRPAAARTQPAGAPRKPAAFLKPARPESRRPSPRNPLASNSPDPTGSGSADDGDGKNWGEERAVQRPFLSSGPRSRPGPTPGANNTNRYGSDTHADSSTRRNQWRDSTERPGENANETATELLPAVPPGARRHRVEAISRARRVPSEPGREEIVLPEWLGPVSGAGYQNPGY